MIAAILLAAGESTRMGRLKQLLPWDGEPLVAWQASQLKEAGADEVIVVLGHAAGQIRAAVPDFATVIENPGYREGRATSLKCGAEAVDSTAEAIVLLSVDQPRPEWLTRVLLERWREGKPLVVSPKFSGGFGHPIVVGGALLAELREVSDETQGLRAVIDRHLDQAVAVEVSNDSVDVDLNTPQDYEAALGSFERGEWGPYEAS